MEEELLTDEILHNIILDFKRKDIPLDVKYRFIELQRKRKNLSTRDICKDEDIGRTTYYSWKRAYDLGKENHDKLIKHGWSETDIQNQLKSHSAAVLVKSIEKKKIDLLIEEAISNLNQYIHKNDYSTETAIKIKELQNVLNRILMRVEK